MGHLYTQTNEAANKIIHFKQNADGTLTEMDRIATGGKGTGGFSPSTGEESVPDSLLSSASVITSRDHKYLFAVNAGNNTVSCFSIKEDGHLMLMDTQSTDHAMVGSYGTASTLAYNDADHVLYVGHSFGLDHIKSFKMMNGKLTRTSDAKSVNTSTMSDRTLTQILISPDNKFLLAYVLFDARPTKDGLTPAKAKNLVVFPIGKDGMLGDARFNESGGVAPFAGCFIPGSMTKFVSVIAAESSATLGMLSSDGMVKSMKLAKIDTMRNGKVSEPSEICWVSVSDDGKLALCGNYGYGTVSVFSIHDDGLKVLASEAAFEKGDGNYKGLAGVVSSGAGDNTICTGYFYQLYANADKIVGYKFDMSGKLMKVGEVKVPHNSTQGLAHI